MMDLNKEELEFTIEAIKRERDYHMDIVDAGKTWKLTPPADVLKDAIMTVELTSRILKKLQGK